MKKISAAVADYFRTTDKWLLLLWIGATALAVLFLSGMYYDEITADGGEMPGTLKMYLVAAAGGLVAALVLSVTNYRFLLKLWKLYVPLCVLFVGMTFFAAFASTRGDNQAWLILPIGDGVSVQPSEFLKISFITTFSIHIAKVREHINRLATVVLLCLHGGAHVLLIQLQGDTGSALIFAGIFLAMLFCAGINWRYIAAAGTAAVAMVPLLWFRIMTEDQKMRFLVLNNPELSEAYAYQQMRAINALGYGGLEGIGIFAESHYYVPEAYNDFIFSFIGQSAGFIGCLGVMALVAAIAFKIMYNSRIASNDEGRFICIGVFAMIVAQTVINLGMCLSLLPVIGVTLPLFSAGGSSVLSMYLGMGLVLSVYRHHNTALFHDE